MTGITEFAADAEPGDSGRVERKLLAWLGSDLAHAKERYLPVWQHCDEAERFYRPTPGAVDKRAELKNGEVDCDVPEASNQVDLMAAVFRENMFQSGESYAVTAIGGEKQRHADLSRMVMDADLVANKYDDEVDLWFQRFLKYRWAGVKVCRKVETEEEYRRVEINPADYAQNPAGFDADVRASLENDQFSGETGDGGMLFVQKEATTRRHAFFVRAIDPRRVCFSDALRPFSQQMAVHEADYYTDFDIERMGDAFLNTDKLGASETTDRITPAPVQMNDGGTSGNYPAYEIWESWAFVPWRRWVESGEINEADLAAFEQDFGLAPRSTRRLQRWQVHWSDGAAVHAVSENWLLEEMAHPYHCESFFEADGATVGDAFFDRIKDIVAALHRKYNDLNYNTQVRGNQSVVYNENSGIKDRDIDNLYRRRGKVPLSINAGSLQDNIYPFETPDLVPGLVRGVDLDLQFLQQYGVPAVMAGTGDSRTATGEQLNDQRAQSKIGSVFTRAMRCWQSALEQIRDLHFRWDTPERLIQLIGEGGAELASREPVGGEAITRRFRIDVPLTMAMFGKAARVQQFTALANVWRNNMGPQAMTALLEMTLEAMDVPRDQIDALMEKTGAYTNPMDEIMVMAYDANADMAGKVRPEDDHAGALAAGASARARFPWMNGQQNFEDWMVSHQAMADQMAMMNSPAAGVGGVGVPSSPNGRMPQTPPPGNGGDGGVRAAGQFASPPDSGQMTAAGITGAGAV